MIVTCRECKKQINIESETSIQHGEICYECWCKEVDYVFGVKLSSPVLLSARELEGFEACRRTGQFNMMTQYQQVKMWCMEHGYHESAKFIRSNFKAYLKGILCGFKTNE